MKNLVPIAALGLILAASSAAAQSRPAMAEALFERADLNNDAMLSAAEFDAAREALFARADANDDGRLTRSEARALRPEGGARERRRPSRQAIQSLRGIDRNNDRAIDLGEFRALGAQRFAAADLDRDGYIARGEIAAFERSMAWATEHAGGARLLFLGVALAFAALEVWLRIRSGRSYDRAAALGTLGVAGGQIVANGLAGIGAGTVYTAVWSATPLRQPAEAVWSWALLFLLSEFLYYWQHRMSHEVRWLWASHSVHHSAEELTLPAAFRLG